METRLVVIGGSAGAISALRQLLAQLPIDFNAAVLIVVHTRRQANSRLAETLRYKSTLPVSFAVDQQPIQNGQVFVAQPNYHLFVEESEVRLIRGPLENMMRPSIDVLFRSAAVAHRNRVTGVLLSGMLDDGVIGLEAIKRCGGTVVVQSPENALHGELPENAIDTVPIDYMVPIEEMESVLQKCIEQPLAANPEVPEDLDREAQMVRRVMFNTDEMNQIGNMVSQSCPSCGGPLWQIKSSPLLQHRCHVGHSFTARTLMEAQDNSAEQALWVALRTLEERGRLLERLYKDFHQKNRLELSKIYRQRAQEASDHANSIRRLLYSLGNEGTMVEEVEESFADSSQPEASA